LRFAANLAAFDVQSLFKPSQLLELAFFWCAEHAQQLGGASPLPNLMVVKG
jgi:hypothetical protein